MRSHYKGAEPTSERIYTAGESIAAWLGLDSWVNVVTMQYPERVERLRELIQEKTENVRVTQ